MYITCSRKADASLKSFTKKLSFVLPNVTYVPRGQTNLGNLFEDARYLGHVHFLKTSSSKKNKIILQAYLQKNKSFFLKEKFVLEPLTTKLTVSVLSLKAQTSIDKPKETFSFLDSCYEKDSLLKIIKEKNLISFKYNEEEVGFSFKLKEKEYD